MTKQELETLRSTVHSAKTTQEILAASILLMAWQQDMINRMAILLGMPDPEAPDVLPKPRLTVVQ